MKSVWVEDGEFRQEYHVETIAAAVKNFAEARYKEAPFFFLEAIATDENAIEQLWSVEPGDNGILLYDCQTTTGASPEEN